MRGLALLAEGLDHVFRINASFREDILLAFLKQICKIFLVRLQEGDLFASPQGTLLRGG
jgi:hypothetical protein